MLILWYLFPALLVLMLWCILGAATVRFTRFVFGPVPAGTSTLLIIIMFWPITLVIIALVIFIDLCDRIAGAR
jgi:hypothetical protein